MIDLKRLFFRMNWETNDANIANSNRKTTQQNILLSDGNVFKI